MPFGLNIPAFQPPASKAMPGLYTAPAAARPTPAIVRTPTPAFAAPVPVPKAYSAPLPQFGGTQPASTAQYGINNNGWQPSNTRTIQPGDLDADGSYRPEVRQRLLNAEIAAGRVAPYQAPQQPKPAAQLPQLSFGDTAMPQFSGGGGGISAEAQQFARLQGQIAQEQWALQQKMVAEAAAYDTPGRRAEAEGRATADTAIAYANAKREMLTRLAGLGVNEGSGKFASLNGQIDLSQASDSVGAINNARRQVEETGYARRVGASDFSRSSAQAGAAANTQAGLDTRGFEMARSSALDRYNAESDAWNRNRTAGLDRYQVDADNFGRSRQATLDQYGVDSDNYNRGRQEWTDQFGVESTFYDRSRQQVLDRTNIDQSYAKLGLEDLRIRSNVTQTNTALNQENDANKYALVGSLAGAAASWFGSRN